MTATTKIIRVSYSESAEKMKNLHEKRTRRRDKTLVFPAFAAESFIAP